MHAGGGLTSATFRTSFLRCRCFNWACDARYRQYFVITFRYQNSIAFFFAEFDAVIKRSGESFLVQQHRLNEDLVFHREPAA